MFWPEFPKSQLVKWDSGLVSHGFEEVIVGNFALPILAIVDFYHHSWKEKAGPALFRFRTITPSIIFVYFKI